MGSPNQPTEHQRILNDLMARGLAFTRNGKGGKKEIAIRFAGVMHLAHERGLVGTDTTLIQAPNESNGYVAIVKAVATFYRGEIQYHFSGTGTCSPDNQNVTTKNYPIEMAESRSITRAVKQGIDIGYLTLADDAPDMDDDEDDAPRSPQRPTPNDDIEDDGSPANQTQVDRLHKLSAALGRVYTHNPAMTRDQAASAIADMVHQFNTQARSTGARH